MKVVVFGGCDECQHPPEPMSGTAVFDLGALTNVCSMHMHKCKSAEQIYMYTNVPWVLINWLYSGDEYRHLVRNGK